MSRKGEYGGSIKEYTVGEQLGCGGFATVYLAQHRDTGHPVAIKKIDKRQIQARGLIERVRQEVEIHAQLNHPSILRLYTFFEDQEYVYLVLELCLNGELQKALRNRDTVLNEDEAQEYLSQIVDGMLYLHSKSIIHRDLTLSNILLDDSGRLKIADFGLATRLLRPDDRHTTMCGTPNYISPEVVTRNPHGLESDVWSLGCMLYVMLVGRPPFDSHGVKESILTKVVSADYQVPSYVSAEARSLIAACLQKDPKNRIRLVDVSHHPFMTGQRITEVSDSGLYTMTTQATVHHHKTSLSVISEAGSEMDERQVKGQASVRNEPFLRHPPSPPVRMKSSPRELPPPHFGVIDTLKRKFTPLPSRQEGDFALTAPCLPRFSKRERDVSEERQRQKIQQEKEESEVQWLHQQQKMDIVQEHNRQQYQQQEPGSNARAASSCSSSCSSHSGCRVGAEAGYDTIKRYGCQELHASAPVHGSKSKETMDYLDHVDHEQEFSGHCTGAKETPFVRHREHRSHSFERGRILSHQKEDRSRERTEEAPRRYVESCGNSQGIYSMEKFENTEKVTSYSRPDGSMDGSSHRRRSRSLENYHQGSREGFREGHRSLKSHQEERREGCREGHRAYSCCHSSQHHRSWCSKREEERLNVPSDECRHSSSERKYCGASLDNPCLSGHHKQISGGLCQLSSRSHNSKDGNQGNILHNVSQSVNSRVNDERPENILRDIPWSLNSCVKDEKQENILHDIPHVHHQVPPTEENTVHQQSHTAPRTPTKQMPHSLGRQGALSHQVSPLSSRRLRKVRYRTKRYLLNILEGGEVCLEQLRSGGGQQRTVVEDVCWISPDGLTIFIYRPNGGSGCEPGDAPPPRPEKDCLHFSYDSLPHKYWKKYKDAARFVKLVKSRTTKITYYTDQAKFYLMENTPDPDFVAVFYQGPKMTKSGIKVDVKKTMGSTCTLTLNTDPAHVPTDLRPCYIHFTQAYSHCLHLDQVLSEACIKIGVACFPAVMGSKPPSASMTALLTSIPATTQARKPCQDKENVSPTSSASSFRSPRNIMSQLGWCEESMASVLVTGLHKTSPPPLVRLPLTPHQPPSTSHVRITPPLPPSKKPPDPITIKNISMDASYVKVVYSDGSRLWVSSADPPSGQLKYSASQDKEPTLYSGENLPLKVKHKVILYGHHLSQQQQHQQSHQGSAISHSSKPK